MGLRGRAALLGLVILNLPAVALSAEGQASDSFASGVYLLVILAHFVLLVGWFLLITRKSGVMKQTSYIANTNNQMNIIMEYMNAMERKTDRMIELLEAIDRKLDKDG